MSKQKAENVCGIHSVSALLESRAQDIYTISIESGCRNSRVKDLAEQAGQMGLEVKFVERRQLDRMAEEMRHQGIIAQAKPVQPRNEKELATDTAALAQPFFLILDGIEDPHNLGACLRVADGAGADGVIIPRDKASPVTPLVKRVAAGAAESMPVYRVANLARSIQQLQKQGVWVIGTSDKANISLYDARLDGPLALVLGAEQNGLRQRTESLCDALVSLPMLGRVSSLNVSVAAGICLYEAVRQRQIRPA